MCVLFACVLFACVLCACMLCAVCCMCEVCMCAVCMCAYSFTPQLLLCDICNSECHTYCQYPVLWDVPQGTWVCPLCSEVSISSHC